jgi:DNA polymerase III alpha subunit
VDWVDYITPDIIEYNKLADDNQQIQQKIDCGVLNYEWNLPGNYQHLDVAEYVATLHADMCIDYTDDQINQRELRLATELSIYYQKGLVEVLRTIIYVINTLSLSNEVWGVGRGSSVSSYVLYVIGAHDVDSFKYELDINDFLHN